MNKNKDGLPDIPKILPVIPVREIVIFPLMIVPLVVSREKSVKAVDQALAQQRMILLLTQKEGLNEDPKAADIYHTGTVALVVKMLKLPDGKMRVLAQGIARANVEKLLSTEPFFQAQINLINDKQVDKDSTELLALSRTVKENLEKSISLGKSIPPEIMLAAASIDDPGRLADLVVSNLDIKTAQAQEILEDVGEKEAVSPPGWKGTVEKMKEHKEITNPYSLAWWQKGKGHKPHYTEKGKKKEKYK